MIDMHNHILFGMDDGAKTIEDSIRYIKEETEHGVSSIIFTPHFNNRARMNCNNIIEDYHSKLSWNFRELQDRTANENIEIELHLGNEIYMDSKFIDILEQGEFQTLANSDYILIEFSTSDTHLNMAEICYESILRGYKPIIAHAERYSALCGNLDSLKNVLNEGAYLQVNASSVIGDESKESCKNANFLLKNKLVSFAASDMHNMTERGFRLHEAYNLVEKKYGIHYAEQIFTLNQQHIISNKYFDNPKLEKTKEGFLSKLFRHK